VPSAVTLFLMLYGLQYLGLVKTYKKALRKAGLALCRLQERMLLFCF